MDQAGQVDTPADFGVDAQATASRWISELDLSEKAQERWIKRGRAINKRYVNDLTDGDGRTEGASQRQFSLLWANIQTLAPAVYARTPTAVVGRRWKDDDPIARSASEVLERAIQFQLDAMDFEDIMTSMRDEYLLVARGQAWVRYVPHIVSMPAPAPANDAEGGDGEVTDNGASYDQVIWEEAIADHVHWTDFGTNPARTWSEVRFVWRRVFMTRKELIKRFGEEKGKACPLDWKPESADEADTQFSKAAVYEIWDKVSRKVFWINRGYSEAPLDERDDPLRLNDFFPCPRPLLGTCGTESIIPTPDYDQYEKQAKQIDTLTRRIGMLADALKVKGFYSSAEKEDLNNLLNTDNNTLIPVASWAALMDKGGLDKLISWFPVEVIANTLKACIETRQQMLSDVFQITGIADIMRGDTDPNETAAAQQIKSTWGSSRVRDKQKELSRFAKDLINIMGQVIASKFSVDTLTKMTGVKMLPDPAAKQQIQQHMQLQAQAAQQQAQIAAAHAQAAGQPPPPAPPPPPVDPKMVRMLSDPTWAEVTQLLQDNALRTFRIDIETDSTIEPNDQDEKQRRVEFVTAVGQYLEKTMSVVQMAPQLLPVMIEGLKWLVRGFRVGREMEDVIDKAADDLEAAAAQKQANPQPNPEAQVQQAKAKADGTKAQAALLSAQADQSRAQTDQFKAKADAQLGAQQIQAEDQRTAAARQADQGMHADDIRADLQKTVIGTISKHLAHDINKPVEVPTR